MTSTQELPNIGQTNPHSSSTITPALSIGFASAVLMWVIAWILHMPGMHVPNAIAIPMLLVPLLVMCILWIPSVSPNNRVKAGAVSGLIAGLVNLLILGSFITEQPETTPSSSCSDRSRSRLS